MSTSSDLNQLLVFHIDEEYYGVDVLMVQEIVRYIKPYVIPNTPEHFRGVTNLRGVIIPIIDLRARFNFLRKEDISESMVVVVSIADKKYGLLVDSVSDVVNVDMANVQEKLDIHTGIDGQYVIGISENAGQMIILIDLEKLFKDKEEIDKLTAVAKNMA